MPIQQTRFLSLLAEAKAARAAFLVLRAHLAEAHNSAEHHRRAGTPPTTILDNLILDLAVLAATIAPADIRIQLEEQHFKYFAKANDRSREKMRRKRQEEKYLEVSQSDVDRVAKATLEIDIEYARAKIPNAATIDWNDPEILARIAKATAESDMAARAPTTDVMGTTELDLENTRRYNERMQKLGESTWHAKPDESFDPNAPLGEVVPEEDHNHDRKA